MLQTICNDSIAFLCSKNWAIRSTLVLPARTSATSEFCWRIERFQCIHIHLLDSLFCDRLLRMHYSARQKKLATELQRSGTDALLITHLPNIRYLYGFTGTAGVLLFHVGGSSPRIVFFTDGRYTQQAAEHVEHAN